MVICLFVGLGEIEIRQAVIEVVAQCGLELDDGRFRFRFQQRQAEQIVLVRAERLLADTRLHDLAHGVEALVFVQQARGVLGQSFVLGVLLLF